MVSSFLHYDQYTIYYMSHIIWPIKYGSTHINGLYLVVHHMFHTVIKSVLSLELSGSEDDAMWASLSVELSVGTNHKNTKKYVLQKYYTEQI